tara:strand:+ start:4006 stop:4530 length:525 start_codon:yes stop_codon:yes gene_type:complete
MLIDLEQDLEYYENNAQDLDAQVSIADVEQKIIAVKKQIANKTDGIDYFMVEMGRQSSLIDAEIASLTTEVARLRNKKKSIKKTEDYFNKELIPMIIETAGNDGVFKTDTAKYKLYETWGPIEVIDEEAIPNAYKRAKIEVDKKGARKAVIEAAENGMGIAGFSIKKVKRVRRS